jgi:glycosyltransferase involved in cell wall biosynthesis
LAWQLWPLASQDADLTHATNFYQLRQSTDVLTLHDLEIFSNPQTEYGTASCLWQRTITHFANNLKAVVVPSEHIRRRINATNHINPPRIEVIPHGIDHIAIDHSPPDTTHRDPDAHYRHRLNLPGGASRRPWLLMVGAYRPRKQFVEALETANRLNGTLIHAGPIHDSHRRDRMHQAADDLNVTIHELGYVDRQTLAWLYHSADVLLHPSRNEGFGFTPLEAAYHGTPTITTQPPALTETLDKLQAPLLSDLNTSIEYALSLDPQKLQHRASAYPWDHSFASHAQLWTDLLPHH